MIYTAMLAIQEGLIKINNIAKKVRDFLIGFIVYNDSVELYALLLRRKDKTKGGSNKIFTHKKMGGGTLFALLCSAFLC